MHTPEGIHTGSWLASLKHAYDSRGLKERNAASYTLLRGRPGVDGSRLTESSSPTESARRATKEKQRW